MNRTLRVLNVAETAKGGIASYLNILEHQREALNCEFSYMIPEAHKDQVLSDKVIAHECGRGLFGTFALAVKLVSVVRQTRPDVIFAHSTFAGISLCLAYPFLGKRVKTLYCPHGWASFRDSSTRVKKVVQVIERVMSFIPRRTVNISHYEHRRTRELGFSNKCTLIENTVLPAASADVLACFDPKKINILFVGRFDRQKGFDILLDAIRKTNKAPNNICFHLVGDSVLAGEPPKFVFSGNVFYHGWINAQDIDSYYLSADFLVMPSRWEGFGLCALEAFRNGLPVIASNRGALPDVVVADYNGLVFDGSASGLYSVIQALDKRHKLLYGDNALRAYNEKHNVLRFIEQYVKLFRSL